MIASTKQNPSTAPASPASFPLMAGEAVLSSFMQALFEKLATVALNEFRSFRAVKKDLQILSSTLSTIQAFIEDAEEKQLNDKMVRGWLAELKDVAYEMDDLLDEYEAETLRSKFEGQSGRHWKKQVSNHLSCYSCCSNGSFQYKIAHRIKGVRGRLDRIARERDTLGLQVLGSVRRLDVAERPQTSSLIDGTSVFGREKDRENIVTSLMVDSSRSNVSILPIVGMGGLGKTTLTQLVYNDHRVKEHFQLRMWVCVSENFDEMKLTRETLESAASGYSSTATTNMNLIQEDLYNKLVGKRFLLVLDDVWNEDHYKWNIFYQALMAGERGSKIIVTTQNENVGRIMGASPPYRLKRLSDDDCWTLFRNYAFVDGDSTKHPNLENIGKEIVKKLKGLPLAAKALGCLLYSKLDELDWKNILKSETWELPPDKNNILPALRLSYRHLPPHLKQCFAFCAVFHKDYVFEKDKLVQIWMALGFIQPQGRRRVEDIGSSYFDDLLSRSFFQSYKGNFVMHDAIHDLAQSISIAECLRLEDNTPDTSPRSAHHVSFSCDNSMSTSFDKFYEFEETRTLLLLRGYKSRISSVPDDLFLKLRHLRVLDLYRRDISELPSSIGDLMQLRFLGLSGTDIKRLPSSIGRLYNLQTLKLKNCNLLHKIPKDVTNLIKLRHLEASNELISKLAGIGKMTCLQKLEEFFVRKDKGYRIGELKNMRELRGHLCIQNVENVVSQVEAVEANLSSKEYITVLDIVWADERNISSKDECLDLEVLEGLLPYSELKELTIKGYAGVRFPSWMGSPSFSYLQTIHLSNCRRCRSLPPLGQLPFLRYLDIVGVYGLACIGQEFSGSSAIKGFPSLNELVIEDVPELEKWCSEDEQLLPSLTDLEIVDCPELHEVPRLPRTITRLRISGTGLSTLPKVLLQSHPASSSLLSTLHVQGCSNLTSLQQGLLGQELTNLKEMTVIGCEKLVSLPAHFYHFASLKTLHIYNCPVLEISATVGALLPNSLEDLRISSCSKLIKPLLTKLCNLHCLTHLQISDCHNLDHFPEEKLPATLKVLGIIDCTSLLSLPARLHELFSLETLIIRNCPLIPSLPEKGLPGMLQELYINECPLLKERCHKGNTSHVPFVEVDGEQTSSGKKR